MFAVTNTTSLSAVAPLDGHVGLEGLCRERACDDGGDETIPNGRELIRTEKLPTDYRGRANSRPISSDPFPPALISTSQLCTVLSTDISPNPVHHKQITAAVSPLFGVLPGS